MNDDLSSGQPLCVEAEKERREKTKQFTWKLRRDQTGDSVAWDNGTQKMTSYAAPMGRLRMSGSNPVRGLRRCWRAAEASDGDRTAGSGKRAEADEVAGAVSGVWVAGLRPPEKPTPFIPSFGRVSFGPSSPPRQSNSGGALREVAVLPLLLSLSLLFSSLLFPSNFPFY